MSATPLMQQYRDIKSRHQDAILFFRMGEFYEMFYDDAETASKTLGLTLTSRNNGGAADVPLAGVPVKAAADYVRRLVQHGFRVAICEQVEDPRLAKGIVRREVIETVTPGVAIADDLLDGARNNYVCAITGGGKRDAGGEERVGVAAADISTGELRLAVVSAASLEPLLARLSPRDIVLSSLPDSRLSLPATMVTEREAWEFDVNMASDDLQRRPESGWSWHRRGRCARGGSGRRADALPQGIAARRRFARASDRRTRRGRTASGRDDAPQSGARRIAPRWQRPGNRRHVDRRPRSYRDSHGRSCAAAMDPGSLGREACNRCATRRGGFPRPRRDRARVAAQCACRRSRSRAACDQSRARSQHAARTGIARCVDLALAGDSRVVARRGRTRQRRGVAAAGIPRGVGRLRGRRERDSESARARRAVECRR